MSKYKELPDEPNDWGYCIKCDAFATPLIAPDFKLCAECHNAWVAGGMKDEPAAARELNRLTGK